MSKNKVNTGKSSEEIFLKCMEDLGIFVYRFQDLYDAKKLGKVANRKPSDFLITSNGVTAFAEVKSTNKNSFSFSNIQPEQWRTAILQTRNGGQYIFYLHFLTVDRWFKVPARTIIDSDKKSVNIKELDDYEVYITK